MASREQAGHAANDVTVPISIDRSDTLGAEVAEQVLLIATRDIDRGERLREIDPVWAEALGQVMRREGQRTPLEVCRLPGQRQWTLVAGGHRHHGAELAGIEHLKAIVVSANRDERRSREISENLWRKDLDPIDRAAFIAEAVAIHKRRAGIDPAKDGRSASINARWKKALSEEAADTNDTLSFVYGWSNDIAQQIGVSKRTIERDLMLYRRLAPSLVQRLREARHPVAGNATQLRALAKLDETDQLRAVDGLIAGARSVAEARGPAPRQDDPTKHLSAFLGAFSRMSLSDKKGALALLRDQMPAGFTLVEGAGPSTQFPSEHQRYRDETLAAIDHAREVIDGIVEDDLLPDPRNAELDHAGRQLQAARLTIAGNGFAMGGADA